MDYEMLVNKDNKMDENIKPVLVRVKSGYVPYREMFLEQMAYKNYLEMQKNALANGYNIDVESAYRTHEYQQKLFDDLVKEKGYEYAKTHVALPYTSEHETGLAVDFVVLKDGKYIIEHDIEGLDETKWVHENAHKYGFILRYPKGKEDITKYSYEPWHIRYVGKDAARKTYENKLTLEEYHMNN